MINSLFKKEIKDRKITRLCHLTKSSKALHILRSASGILATDFIQEDVYDANDESRLDGKTDFVNCSIQYPNYWYWRKVKNKDPLFKEWIIIFIKPSILLKETTEFCFTNAAYHKGRHIKRGYESFKELFSDTVCGKRVFKRTPNMLSCCPTDDQAEVLVYNNVPLNDIIGIAVKDENQAEREYRRWYKNLNDIPKIDIILAPDLFNGAWSQKVREGIRPKEMVYQGGE
jgi:hypothetical protein